MTVRTPPSYLQNITLVSAGHTAQNDRLSQGSLWTPNAVPLQGRTGIVPAASGGNGEVSVVSNTLVRVQAFRAVIQGTRAAAQGQYVVVNDSAVDLAIDAQASGVSRRDLLIVNVCDTAFAPDTLDTARLIVVKGTAAASNPSAPALGGTNLGNYCILGTINVPATGGTVTFTPAAGSDRPGGSVVAVGGIMPVPAGDPVVGVSDGQYRHNPVNGLERWSGALGRWDPVAASARGVFPSGDQTIAPGGTFGYEAIRLNAAYAGQRFTAVAQVNTLCNTAQVQQTVQLTRNSGNFGSNWNLGESMFEYVERYTGGAGAEWRMLTRFFDFTVPAAGLAIVNLMVGVGTGGSTVTVQGMRCWALPTGLIT